MLVAHRLRDYAGDKPLYVMDRSPTDDEETFRMSTSERAEMDAIKCGTEKEKHKYGGSILGGETVPRRLDANACVCHSLGGMYAAWNCGIIFGFEEIVSAARIPVLRARN